MSVYCECCVLSGRGLCDGLITRPEECYRVWRVSVSVTVKPTKNKKGGQNSLRVVAPMMMMMMMMIPCSGVSLLVVLF
jgi:hypothetical protein